MSDRPRMRSFPRGVLTALLILAVPPEAIAQSCPPPEPTSTGAAVLADVRYFADDALGGRAPGTNGGLCAAAYLAARFDALGLRPGAPNGRWLQPFPLRVGARLAGENRVEIAGDALALGRDWSPFGFSGSGTVAGPLVYGGAGVARPGEAPVEMEGRIVVVEAATPGAGGLYSDPHFKGTIAAGRGARAVLVLLDEDRGLPALDGEIRPFLSAPVVAVSGVRAAAVREAARAGREARLQVGVEMRAAEAANVLALLPGSDPELADEVVVIGAHFDHLGRGGEGSLEPDSRAVHNGADDNASGTAAMLEAARRLRAGPPPARSVLFIGFDAEERGLIGSGRYVADPVRPLDRTVAMLNLDMVGRLRANTLTVYGVGTASEWERVLDEANAATRAPLTLVRLPDGYGPSDHASFYARGVPVLHFFTNTHEDYHRPSDDWQRVNVEGVERVAALVAETALRLAGAPGRSAAALTPVRNEPPAPPGGRPAGGGYGPYFGSIPDMTPVENGVRLTGVRDGSPADRAGLRAGDVIVEFGGAPVGDLYAFTYALQDRQPGDEVTVTVLRGGERLTVRAVLEERR